MARARTLTLKTQVEVTGADKLNNLGKKLQKTGAVLTLGVTAPLLALGGVAANAASDLNESMNAVNVTFGETADAIEKIGQTSADSFGLSQRAFNEVATRFSAFASTVAGEGGDVAGVIEDITRRGSDFASVFNLEVDDALALFQSGLAGETEPLRKFGLDLSAAAVEAHAVASGISDGNSALTEAQKVQARYSLLMQQTSKVQGDFANTSEDVANAQRIAAARAEDAAAKLGQKFLPVQQKVIAILSDALDAWSNLPAPMQDAIVIFGVAAAALGPLLGVIGTFMRAGKGLIAFAPKIGLAFHAMLGPIGLVTAAVGLLAAGFATDFLGMRTRLERDIADIDDMFANMSDTARHYLGATADAAEELERIPITADREFEAFTAVTHQHLLAAKGIVETGVTDMATEMGTLPEKSADELLANQFHLTDATTQLLEFMDQALAPAEEVFQARMFLASQAAADGLASGNPLVIAKTQELIAAANAVLEQHGKSAFNYGFNFGAQYAAGVVNSLGLVRDAGRQLGGALANQVRIESEPKDHSSPLFGHMKWGANFVRDIANSVFGSLGLASRAGGAFAAALVPSLAMSPVSVAGGGGGGTTITNIYLQWDGEPPKGRDEAEIVANLQRLSPLIGGKLAPGFG